MKNLLAVLVICLISACTKHDNDVKDHDKLETASAEAIEVAIKTTMFLSYREIALAESKIYTCEEWRVKLPDLQLECEGGTIIIRPAVHP